VKPPSKETKKTNQPKKRKCPEPTLKGEGRRKMEEGSVKLY